MKLQRLYLKVENCVQYSRKAYNRWVLLGIAVLLSSPSFSKADSEERDPLDQNTTGLVTENDGEKNSDTTWGTPCTAEVQTRKATWRDVFIAKRSRDSTSSCISPEKDVSCPGESDLEVDSTNATNVTHPKCDEATFSCNAPLFCFDFQSVCAYASIIPDPPQVVRVSPHQLEAIVENPDILNCCAVVLFYAPWCPFSVQFARRFNALGRSFKNLPILAVDLAENDPYKYILAYLPLVAFYYRGKIIFKFNVELSFEYLISAITNVTGFVPLEVNLTDPANDYPVPTQREDNDWFFLLLAGWWVGFLCLVYILRTGLLRNCLIYCRTRFLRTKVD